MLIITLTHFSANSYLQLQRSHCCALLAKVFVSPVTMQCVI